MKRQIPIHLHRHPSGHGGIIHWQDEEIPDLTAHAWKLLRELDEPGHVMSQEAVVRTIQALAHLALANQPKEKPLS